MPREIPAIRIFPMSDKIPGFVGKGIDDVQQRTFLRDLARCGGRYRYAKSGLNAEPGTLVLFQYRARIIASAIFLRDEKYTKPKRGCGGAMYFDVKSIRVFTPLDVAAMRKVWPRFTRFGHVKQVLNPGMYSAFKRALDRVASPPV